MNAIDRRVTLGLACVLLSGNMVAGADAPKDSGTLVCESFHAKQSPEEIKTEIKAVKFTAPNGDGRRGAAGLLIQAKEKKDTTGTRITFTFRRSSTGYGFQVIHPLEQGHLLISVDPSVVRLYRGGSWADIGWGNPKTSEEMTPTAKAREVLPIQPDKDYDVTSELGRWGRYRLSINGTLICEHQVKDASTLVLEIKDHAFWGGPEAPDLNGSFRGRDFESKLRPGQAGVILGPTDRSGNEQRLSQIRIGADS
jgi:hypothetical protein